MNYYKIKLTDYQIHGLECRLAATYCQVETMVLDKYKSHDIANLNALDFDDICNDIEDWHRQLSNPKKEQ